MRNLGKVRAERQAGWGHPLRFPNTTGLLLPKGTWISPGPCWGSATSLLGTFGFAQIKQTIFESHFPWLLLFYFVYCFFSVQNTQMSVGESDWAPPPPSRVPWKIPRYKGPRLYSWGLSTGCFSSPNQEASELGGCHPWPRSLLPLPGPEWWRGKLEPTSSSEPIAAHPYPGLSDKAGLLHLHPQENHAWLCQLAKVETKSALVPGTGPGCPLDKCSDLHHRFNIDHIHNNLTLKRVM